MGRDGGQPAQANDPTGGRPTRGGRPAGQNAPTDQPGTFNQNYESSERDSNLGLAGPGRLALPQTDQPFSNHFRKQASKQPTEVGQS